ncbi:MAG: carbohydrate ABC transporter permease, partial [Bradyrhizobium sp.]
MTDSVLPNKTPSVIASDDSEGMSYLESLPRRVLTLYIPLGLIL